MPDRDKAVGVTVTATPAPPVMTTPGTTPTGGVGTLTIPPKRSPGHRGADVKDTVAEMAAKAHEISLEAGSKMAAAMKDVIGAAAGLTGLVLESARDLLQYMVRRGQMTQEEADKLMREVEASHSKRKPAAASGVTPKVSPRTPTAHHAPVRATSTHVPHVRHVAKAATKHHAPAKAKKPSGKRPTMKPAAKKHPVRSASKSRAKASAKSAKRR